MSAKDLLRNGYLIILLYFFILFIIVELAYSKKFKLCEKLFSKDFFHEKSKLYKLERYLLRFSKISDFIDSTKDNFICRFQPQGRQSHKLTENKIYNIFIRNQSLLIFFYYTECNSQINEYLKYNFMWTSYICRMNLNNFCSKKSEKSNNPK